MALTLGQRERTSEFSLKRAYPKGGYAADHRSKKGVAERIWLGTHLWFLQLARWTRHQPWPPTQDQWRGHESPVAIRTNVA